MRIMRRLAGTVLALMLLLQPAMAADIELAVAKAAAFDPYTFQPAVEVVLTPEASKVFGKLTADNIGKVIELYVDGALVSSPVVQSPILGGKLTISGAMTDAEAKALADRLADPGAVITLRPIGR